MNRRFGVTSGKHGKPAHRAPYATNALVDMAGLREGLVRLRKILDTVSDLILDVDSTGTVTDANSRTRDFLGREPDQVIGMPFRDCLHSDDAERVESLLQRLVNCDSEAECCEARLTKADGSPCWCEMHIGPIDDGDRARGQRIIARNISQVKVAEQRIRRLEAVREAMVATSLDHVMLTDLEGRIQFVNGPANHGEIEQIPGRSVFEYADESYHGRIDRCLRYVAATSQPASYDIHRYEDDKLVYSSESRVNPVIQDGEVVALTIISTETTDGTRVEAHATEQQDRLARFERVQATDELAISIAHEVDQPLAAIANFSGACARLASAAEIDRTLMQQLLGKINSAAIRAGEVIRRLRAFIKDEDTQLRATDIHTIIGESLTLLANDLQRCGAQHEVLRNSLECDVLCDSVQIQQVLVNLIKNACDALAEPGIEVRFIQIDTWNRDEMVEVVVSDSGAGFAGLDTEQIFQRYVTSKKDGTGIGLALSRSIVEAHGGRLWAERSRLGGAAFHFTLPKAEQQKIARVNSSP